MDTSKADIGSSQTMNFGFNPRALAIPLDVVLQKTHEEIAKNAHLNLQVLIIESYSDPFP